MTSNDKILSQEESEALLAESDAAAPASTGSPASGIREVDLSLWEQVALDRIPAFDAINDDIAEAIDSAWAGLCRRAIHTSPAGAEQLPWRKYMRELEASMSVNLFEIKSLGQPGLVVLRRETVYALVDLFFGGNAHAGHDPALSEPTQMESRLAQRFTQTLVPEMQKAWNHHVPIEIRASETSFDPDTTHVASPTEPVVVVGFTFDMRDTTHRIDLVLPARLVGRLKSQQFSSAPDKNKSARWNQKLSDDLRTARINLRAVLGSVQVNLSEIANARPGDIFTCESLKTVRVFAGDQAIFEGTLGAHRGHHAVKVQRALARKHSGESNG